MTVLCRCRQLLMLLFTTKVLNEANALLKPGEFHSSCRWGCAALPNGRPQIRCRLRCCRFPADLANPLVARCARALCCVQARAARRARRCSSLWA